MTRAAAASLRGLVGIAAAGRWRVSASVQGRGASPGWRGFRAVAPGSGGRTTPEPSSSSTPALPQLQPRRVLATRQTVLPGLNGGGFESEDGKLSCGYSSFKGRRPTMEDPLHMNIARRGVELDTNCVVCHRQFEDGGHLFFRCQGVKSLWRVLQLDDVCQALMICNRPLRVLEHVLLLPYERMMATIALLWCWWTECNKEIHNERRLSADEFQFNIKRHTHEWNQFYKPKVYNTASSVPRWTPPSENFIKLNTDGAFVESTHMSGWGAIAHDTAGSIVSAAAGNTVNASDALHSESIALQNGVRLADQLGIGRITISTDS